MPPASAVENAAGHRVTVVVLTRDRLGPLGHTLRRLAGLSPRPPVIVVDNGSRDGTVAHLAREQPWCRVIALGQNLGPAGRNVGARMASTPYVAFCDDDAWWTPEGLTAAVAVLDADESVGAVAARVLVGSDGRDDPTCAEMRDSPLPARAGCPEVVGFLACGAMVRRRTFLAIGGFERRFGIGGEEELLAIDLLSVSRPVVYCDAAIVHHHPPVRLAPAAHRRRRRQARNAIWCAWLRRPAGRAARTTLRLVPHALRDGAVAGGLIDSIRDGGWTLRDRRTIAPGVEARLRRVERRREAGHAR